MPAYGAKAMDFVNNLGDCANLPEFAVGGVARAEIIDNCVVRVTFFKPCSEPAAEKIPVCELVWTIPAWLAARAALAQIAIAIVEGGLGPVGLNAIDVSLLHH